MESVRETTDVLEVQVYFLLCVFAKLWKNLAAIRSTYKSPSQPLSRKITGHSADNSCAAKELVFWVTVVANDLAKSLDSLPGNIFLFTSTYLISANASD